MHQALLVPEVLLEIFAYVPPTQTTSTRKVLAALARTCKIFHEPAMDLLWTKIDGLEPLLGCVARLHPLIYHSGIRVSIRLHYALFVFFQLTERLHNSGTNPGRKVSSHYLPMRPVNFCVTPPAYAHCT
ncbi:hypothetical protein EV424DRAFT_1325217 [Suillus variegatus]|nr:hypothetical protein EV424DRAFT_1325217 [Suillus variegatus]